MKILKHPIKLPPRQSPVVATDDPYLAEKDWCRDNVGKFGWDWIYTREYDYSNDYSVMVFYFTDPARAVLFQVHWG